MIQPRNFKGTRDFLPQEMIAREEIIQSLRQTFSLFGFSPVETPALEYLDILLGKYGEEGDQLLYRLAYKDGKTLALRYDLTVPLSRMVAMQPNLVLPFKRYQMQPVWRADRPQIRQGRFREFFQCDADIVGAPEMIADAEIMALTCRILSDLGFPKSCLRFNHRRLLTAIVCVAGFPIDRETQICTIIDKLDKIGLEGVRQELQNADFEEQSVNRLFEFLAIEGDFQQKISALEKTLGGDQNGRRAIDELLELERSLHDFQVPSEAIRFDLYLARGLEYYTGPIFEAFLPDQRQLGSITGGGRYDSLIGTYLGRDIPATGISLGLDRIFEALNLLELIDKKASRSQLLFCNMGPETQADVIQLLQAARAVGINAETIYRTERIKKQILYADRKGIPFVAFLGTAEKDRQEVTVKRLSDGTQKSIPQNNFVGEFQRWAAQKDQRS